MTNKEIIDIEAVRERLNHDDELLADIVGIFLDHCQEALATIQRDIISQDTKALEASAHTLRGYLVSLHAERASETALQLEIKGRLNDCVGIRYLFSKLEEEIEQLKPLLKQCTSGCALS
jgi:HPt (histidine-containing phosphotransfer) domain-containing protein